MSSVSRPKPSTGQGREWLTARPRRACRGLRPSAGSSPRWPSVHARDHMAPAGDHAHRLHENDHRVVPGLDALPGQRRDLLLELLLGQFEQRNDAPVPGGQCAVQLILSHDAVLNAELAHDRLSLARWLGGLPGPQLVGANDPGAYVDYSSALGTVSRT